MGDCCQKKRYPATTTDVQTCQTRVTHLVVPPKRRSDCCQTKSYWVTNERDLMMPPNCLSHTSVRIVLPSRNQSRPHRMAKSGFAVTAVANTKTARSACM